MEGLSPELQEQLIQTAADLLWGWTERVFGLEEVTVRPCRHRRPQRPSTFEGWGPVVFRDGVARSISCGVCLSSRCNCGPDGPAVLVLPGPIDDVVAVQVDGVILDEDAYEVLDRRRLIRRDGSGWPTKQRLERPLGDPDTWGVTYVRGLAVPTGGRLAQGKLACELALAFTGGKGCQLPQRVQSVTRQGVTVAVIDAFEGLDRGRTGIWLIDSWVSSVTVSSYAPAAVLSPDIGRGLTRG